MAKKNWIQDINMKKGELHKDLGVKQGEKIPEKKMEKAAKGSGVVAKRARLAETLKSLERGK